MTTWWGVTASFLAASAATSWLVPALMFLLVIVVSWAGLRWIRSEHLEALRSVPLFSSLSKHQLMRVLRAARAIEFQPNAEIIREGEAGKGLYTVTDGSAKVLVDGNQLATGPGSYFGEISVIDGGPRTATIVAATRVSTLELAPSAFLPILDSEPQVALALSAELCRWLRDTGGDSGTAAMTHGSIERGSLSFARDCERPSIPIGRRERRLEDAGSGS